MESYEHGAIATFLRLQKALRWLGITPFQRRNGDTLLTKRLAPLLVLMLHTGLMIYVWYEIINNVFKKFQIIAFVTMVLMDCSQILIISVSCLGAIYYENNWKMLLIKMNKFEGKWEEKIVTTIRIKYLLYFLNFGVVTMICCMQLIFLYLSTKRLNIDISFYFKEMATMFSHLFKFLNTQMICYFAVAYVEKYNKLAEILGREKWEGNLSHFRKRCIRKKLERILSLYREICLIAMEFYSILRWPIFFIILSHVFGILNMTMFSVVMVPIEGFNGFVIHKICFEVINTVSQIYLQFNSVCNLNNEYLITAQLVQIDSGCDLCCRH